MPIRTDAKLRQQLSQKVRGIIVKWDNERMVKSFQEAIDYALQRRSRWPRGVAQRDSGGA
jgi:hypothetical protein